MSGMSTSLFVIAGFALILPSSVIDEPTLDADDSVSVTEPHVVEVLPASLLLYSLFSSFHLKPGPFSNPTPPYLGLFCISSNIVRSID